VITGEDVVEVIRRGIEKALSIDGVSGVFILYCGIFGKSGQVPKLIKVNPQE
jgi:ApbE superfamily uncharacterized protein (UPF0280 family)